MGNRNEVLLNKRGLIEQASKVRSACISLAISTVAGQRYESSSAHTFPLAPYLTSFWKHFALCVEKEA